MRQLYAIRDRIANDLVGTQMYILFAFKTDQQAVRYFADAILDEKSVLNKHFGDYELIKVGHLNDTGQLQEMSAVFDERGIKIHTDWTPQIIITGDALVSAQQKPLALEG